MKKRALLLTLCLTAGLGLLAPTLAAENSDEKAQRAAAAQKCLVAEVNPVTGSVYCIKPPGAPVAPPPVADAPCTKDPRFKGQWTWGPNCKP
jgi:hypothetical protein